MIIIASLAIVACDYVGFEYKEKNYDICACAECVNESR